MKKMRLPRRPRQPSKFQPIFLGLVGIANLIAVIVALIDHGWTAMGIAFLYGPIMNAVIAVIGLIIAAGDRGDPEFSWGNYLPICIGVPVMVTVIDLILISLMGMHGS